MRNKRQRNAGLRKWYENRLSLAVTRPANVQQMADQMSMPMSVSVVNVTGAKNIRRGFLDPIFSPLLADSLNSPKTVGDVLSKLQVASAKLSALRMSRPLDHLLFRG